MSDYYILITDAGAALEASAHASGTTVKLAKFSICDGGVDFIPDPAATTFPNEFPPINISSLTVSADDAAVMVAQCIIPGSSGGYTIRGIAIYTDDGTLYATGNYPSQPKPAPDSGFAASLEILAQLAVSDTADISLFVTEGDFLTEAQGDTLYLRQDKNLSDVDDVELARDNLGLGSSATHDAEDFLSTITGGTVNGDIGVKGSLKILDASGVEIGRLSYSPEKGIQLINDQTGTAINLLPNGLVELPTVSGALGIGEYTTGMYLESPGNLILQVGGQPTVRFSKNATGKVGLNVINGDVFDNGNWVYSAVNPPTSNYPGESGTRWIDSSGFIIQTGHKAGGDNHVNFWAPFPNQLLSINITGGDASSPDGATYYNEGLNGFDANVAGDSFFWTAYGR